MDNLGNQLATILQDIKSPTLDALRAGTVADGLGSLLFGLVATIFLIVVVISVLKLSEDSKGFLFFKGPFDTSDVNAARALAAFIGVIMLLFMSMSILSPTNWLKIFYPDVSIAERALRR